MTDHLWRAARLARGAAYEAVRAIQSAIDCGFDGRSIDATIKDADESAQAARAQAREAVAALEKHALERVDVDGEVVVDVFDGVAAAVQVAELADEAFQSLVRSPRLQDGAKSRSYRAFRTWVRAYELIKIAEGAVESLIEHDRFPSAT
jgi:hypothetical protein